MDDYPRFDRRGFLALTTGCLALPEALASAADGDKKPIARAAAFVKPEARWDAEKLYEFLNALPDEAMLSLMKGLGMVDEKAGTGVLSGKSKDVREIQKRALWLSNNILAYPFRDETTLNYHELVGWVASSAGIPEKDIKGRSTFDIEREIQKRIFVQLWDKMTPAQRLELLSKIDPKGDIKNKAAVTALTGAAAIGTLSATVAFTGFAFYTTMSVVISTAAGFFGFTLPFAAYTGASSLVAFLSGPVGLAIMGLAALTGLALAGRADVRQTTAFVCQIHALKVAALIADGVPENKVFAPHPVGAPEEPEPMWWFEVLWEWLWSW